MFCRTLEYPGGFIVRGLSYILKPMAFEDYKTKDSVTIVYTGEGKGKTSAAIGLLARALGSGHSVAFAQFIKYWDVGEHKFLEQISAIYPDKFTFYKGGLGFYAAK